MTDHMPRQMPNPYPERCQCCFDPAIVTITVGIEETEKTVGLCYQHVANTKEVMDTVLADVTIIRERKGKE